MSKSSGSFIFGKWGVGGAIGVTSLTRRFFGENIEVILGRVYFLGYFLAGFFGISSGSIILT